MKIPLVHCGICWRERNSYGMLLFYASLSHACKLWSYPVISFPLVHLLLSLLPWSTLFVFPEPYFPHHSFFSFQISLSILFINLSVWLLKWKKWVFTWAWNHFWWSHKNGFNVFFYLEDVSGRSSSLRKVLSHGSCRAAKTTKLLPVAFIFIRSLVWPLTN